MESLLVLLFLPSFCSEKPDSMTVLFTESPNHPWKHCRCCCSAAQLCPPLCYAMDYSTPGLLVLRHLPEFAHIHVHWVDDAIQPSHPLSLFSSCPQCFPASESFPMSRLFTLGGQSIRASSNLLVKWGWGCSSPGFFPVLSEALVSRHKANLKSCQSITVAVAGKCIFPYMRVLLPASELCRIFSLVLSLCLSMCADIPFCIYRKVVSISPCVSLYL